MQRFSLLLVIIVAFLTIHGVGYANKIFNQGFAALLWRHSKN